MILDSGKETDPHRLLPVRYPFARQCYKAETANHWTPDTIPMGDDVTQWKTGALTPEERQMVLMNLGFFSTAESLTANNLVLALFRHINDPGCREYMLLQAATETIHSETFVYCCDTLGLDPDEVYTAYENIKCIKDKDDFVVNLTKNLLDPTYKIDTSDPESIQRLLYDLIGFYVIMEGIFFYAGFCMMLGLKRRNVMKGVGEQFDYIQRDECVSADTYFLTPDGWVPVTDLTNDTLILQWNEDGTTEFVKPINLSKSKVDHVYRIKNKQGHVDQCVSENHRVPYFTKDGNLKVMPAKDVVPTTYQTFPVTGDYSGVGKVTLSPKERFLIAFQADGWLGSQCVNSSCDYVSAYFRFKKDRKKERLLKLIEELGYEYSVSVSSQDAERATYRVSVPKNDFKATKSFKDWVTYTDITQEWCREFIDEAVQWDGHISADNSNRILYDSTVEDNSEVVQTIACLAGYRTNWSVKDDKRSKNFSTIYRVNILKDSNNVSGQCLKKERLDYDGFVYGVEVPSSYIVIRRNGAISVTGNSVHLMFGNELVGVIKHEYPHSWTQEFQDTIVSLIKDAVVLEQTYAREACLPGVQGLNVNQICDYVEYIADRRLARLGLPTVYGKSNPFPWMEASVDLPKRKNFFESRVTDYQTGSLEW